MLGGCMGSSVEDAVVFGSGVGGSSPAMWVDVYGVCVYMYACVNYISHSHM